MTKVETALSFGVVAGKLILTSFEDDRINNETFSIRMQLQTRTINHRSKTPMTIQELEHFAPSIFAGDKHASRSEHYVHIPTTQLIYELGREGFHVYSVSQSGTRSEDMIGFTKHQLRLRHESSKLEVGGSFPEIILLNSHNGSSSYQMTAGMFRLVCSNGLCVSEGTLGTQRVSHRKADMDNIIEGCVEVLESLPMVVESVKEMQALTLTDKEQRIFANAASELKYDVPLFDSSKLLRPHRWEDAKQDIYTTFNVVQENLIEKGGIKYTAIDEKGRKTDRRTRPVKGIDQNNALNRALWRLAEEMAALKNA